MKLKKNRHVTCDNCDGTTETVHITKTHRRHGETYQIENVEAEQCPNCGARYFNADVVFALNRKIDRSNNRAA